MTDEKWAQLFTDLDEDIGDRRGLKWEWREAKESGAIEDISTEWRKIIEKHIEATRLATARDCAEIAESQATYSWQAAADIRTKYGVRK